MKPSNHTQNGGYVATAVIHKDTNRTDNPPPLKKNIVPTTESSAGSVQLKGEAESDSTEKDATSLVNAESKKVEADSGISPKLEDAGTNTVSPAPLDTEVVSVTSTSLSSEEVTARESTVLAEVAPLEEVKPIESAAVGNCVAPKVGTEIKDTAKITWAVIDSRLGKAKFLWRLMTDIYQGVLIEYLYNLKEFLSHLTDAGTINLYSFASQASRYMSSNSNIKVSTEDIYLLVCDSISSAIIPKNHIDCHLSQESRNTTWTGFRKIQSKGQGHASEGVFHEITRVCENHKINGTTLQSYATNMRSLYIFDQVSSTLYSLLGVSSAQLEDLNEFTNLRLSYAFLAELLRVGSSIDNGDIPLVMSFLQGDEELQNSIQKNDFSGFVRRMRSITLEDPLEVRGNLAYIIGNATVFVKSAHNVLIMSAILYDKSSESEYNEHLLARAASAIETLMLYSPKLYREVVKIIGSEGANSICSSFNRENVATVLDFLGKDVERLASLIKMPEFKGRSPIDYAKNHGLEKIAAAHLILYPGVTMDVADIVLLENGTPILLNARGSKINPYNCPPIDVQSKKIGVVQDICKLFSSLQAIVGQLDSKAFFNSLANYCTMIRKNEYASKAQTAIKTKLSTKAFENVRMDNLVPIVAYESILPRVKEIEEFLKDKDAVLGTMQITELLYCTENEVSILTSPSFLSWIGCLKSEDSSDEKSEESTNEKSGDSSNDDYTSKYKEYLFDRIQEYSTYMTGRYPIGKPESRDDSYSTLPLLRLRGLQYITNGIDDVERRKVIKSLSKRSTAYIVRSVATYFSGVVISSAILAAPLIYSTTNIALPERIALLIVPIIFAVLCSVILVNISRTKKNYIMSTPSREELQGKSVSVPSNTSDVQNADKSIPSETISPPSSKDEKEKGATDTELSSKTAAAIPLPSTATEGAENGETKKEQSLGTKITFSRLEKVLPTLEEGIKSQESSPVAEEGEHKGDDAVVADLEEQHPLDQTPNMAQRGI